MEDIEMAESKKNFRRRVSVETGVRYQDIPFERHEGGALPGLIFCRRGDIFVCAGGYPDSADEETGEEIWDPRPETFVRVHVGI